ncbi:hypothetical protein D9M68_804130 [compost metagenome]
MEIAGENAESIKSLLAFLEQRCSNAAGGVAVEVAAFAQEEASDAEIGAARARAYKVRSYLTERFPQATPIYSVDVPRTPARRYNKWDELAPRATLPGAVHVNVGCLGVP